MAINLFLYFGSLIWIEVFLDQLSSTIPTPQSKMVALVVPVLTIV